MYNQYLVSEGMASSLTTQLERTIREINMSHETIVSTTGVGDYSVLIITESPVVVDVL